MKLSADKTQILTDNGLPVTISPSGLLYVTTPSGMRRQFAADPRECEKLLTQVKTELKIINPEPKIEQEQKNRSPENP